MLKTSLVLLSLILSSLMRHQRFVARLARFLSGFTSCIVSLTLAAFCLNDLTLFGRDADESDEDGGLGDSSSRGADVGAEVGAGPREVLEDIEENDRKEGDGSTGVAGMGEEFSSMPGGLDVDIRGLCTADCAGLS
jgi:hypothetical protein